MPVQIYTSESLMPTRGEIASLARVAAIPGVRQVVGLPDLHVKPSLEAPSSLAVATGDSIVLGLSSPSPGCGMALAALPLSLEDANPPSLDAFFQFLARRLPVRGARPMALEDARQVLLSGAAAALHRFDLDPLLLEHIESGGNALSDRDSEQALEAMPAAFLPLAAREFGRVGRGNHFLELQVVDDVRDPHLAERWGLETGQIVVMYHADSGTLGALTGRTYAYRRKNTWRGRWIELRYKTLFHLSQARSVRELYRRGRGYFYPRRFTSLPAGSLEAQRAIAALGLAANYAYANRIAILAAVQEGLWHTWGPQLPGPRLLYDVSHNSIRRETIRGEGLWVHRHNASRALPPGHPDLAGSPFFETGQPLLLPGTDQTHSYLCVARPGTAGSLYSVSHGTGRTADRMGSLQPGNLTNTRLYDYERGFVHLREHRSDDGLEAVLSILAQSDLASPVVRLRPLAVLKDHPA